MFHEETRGRSLSLPHTDRLLGVSRRGAMSGTVVVRTVFRAQYCLSGNCTSPLIKTIRVLKKSEIQAVCLLYLLCFSSTLSDGSIDVLLKVLEMLNSRTERSIARRNFP